MKLYIHAATTPYEYNQKQTQVGSPLKTLKGSRIARSSKYGVGKEIGGSIYVHKNYAKDVVPNSILRKAIDILNEFHSGFKYNCIRYTPATGQVSFQESPDFDTAREPIVGDYITVDTRDGSVRTGHSDYIWHHKWTFVTNSYDQFDVAEAWNWSKRWLSVLEEPSDGNGIARWNAQLDKYNLPHDE